MGKHTTSECDQHFCYLATIFNIHWHSSFCSVQPLIIHCRLLYGTYEASITAFINKTGHKVVYIRRAQEDLKVVIYDADCTRIYQRHVNCWLTQSRGALVHLMKYVFKTSFLHAFRFMTIKGRNGSSRYHVPDSICNNTYLYMRDPATESVEASWSLLEYHHARTDAPDAACRMHLESERNIIIHYPNVSSSLSISPL